MDKRNHAQRIRPTFFDLLNDVVAAAFPKTVVPGRGIIANRCPKYAAQLCHYIQMEAYEDNQLRANSMLQAINKELQTETQHILNHIHLAFPYDHDSREEYLQAQENIRKYHKYFSKVKPHILEHTFGAYENSTQQYTKEGNRGWYYWLNTQKPKRHVFSLLQLLIYGLLRPQEKETPEQRTNRIVLFYEKILTQYLGMSDLPKEEMEKYYRFTWETKAEVAITLTNGTRGLIGTLLFLFNLLLYSDGSDGLWSKEEDNLIGMYQHFIVKSVEEDSIYITTFKKTQTAQVFQAQPYATAEEMRKLKRIDFILPEQLPWKDLSASDSVRTIIQAPAACGKTVLYQLLGAALTRGMLPSSKRGQKDVLAQQLHLGKDDNWVTIALNAQQYIWYWTTQGIEQCEDFVDIFFRANFTQKKISPEIIDITMKTIVKERLQEAHDQRRLIFLFDGFDELTDPQIRIAFRKGMKNFYESYHNAHICLFTRPLGREDRVWLSKYCPQLFQLTSLSKTQMETFKSLTPELNEKFKIGRYAAAAKNPLMLTLLCKHQEESFSHITYHYVRQIIFKEYDSLGRKMMLPQNIEKKELLELLEQIAWNTAVNPNQNLIKQLGELVKLPAFDLKDTRAKKLNEQRIHSLARQIGVLQYSEELKDYRFITPQIQAILAAGYITGLLNLNADPTIIRSLLQQLSDEIYWNIIFVLVHDRSQPNPLLTELLMVDFSFREWNERYTDSIVQDISAMLNGIYGKTPLQTAKSDTLRRIFSMKSNSTCEVL